MLRRGDYVLCNFPFSRSQWTGAFTHIVLCAGTRRQGDASFAIVFYTTSQIDYPGVRRPRQYIFVDKARAPLIEGEAMPRPYERKIRLRVWRGDRRIGARHLRCRSDEGAAVAVACHGEARSHVAA